MRIGHNVGSGLLSIQRDIVRYVSTPVGIERAVPQVVSDVANTGKNMVGDTKALVTGQKSLKGHGMYLSLIHISEPTRPY